MVEIVPVQVETIRLKDRGYKRNGNGVWCPNFRVISWWAQRYIVKSADGESAPLTLHKAKALAKELKGEGQ